MDDWLNLIIYVIGSGTAFFLGAALILLGVVLASWRLGRNLLVVAGSILVTISATPLSWVCYAILAVVTLAWLVWEESRQTASSTPRKILYRGSIAAVWLVQVGLELPYHFMPVLPPVANSRCFLIGDSVSAGMREADGGTWPKLLAKKHGIDMHDFSIMGASVASAQQQAARIGDTGGLVILEIGGNDLLGSTTAEEFEDRLDALLTQVCRNDRTSVMLELPLPPFANRFGLIQRRLAARHNVILIPKRFFIDILTTSGATVDGIHLSRSGHELMANRMWGLLAPAWAKPSGK